MNRRVAITGVGAVSALGPDLDAALAKLDAGETGIGLLEVAEELTIPAGAVADDWIEEPSRGVDRTTRLALTAAAEALDPAELPVPPHRAGCVLGAGLGGVETAEGAYEQIYGARSKRLRPTSIPAAMYNAAVAALSERYRCSGPGFAISSACASANHAIGVAASLIAGGSADLMISGGADAPLFPGIVTGWRSMRVLAAPAEDPARSCRPFSRDRDGLVLAEGAGIVVLEEMEHARARDAEILGEVVGFGWTSDAGHITDPSATGAARAMTLALEMAEVAPGEVCCLNAHGTATRANDRTEAEAIHDVFGESAATLPVFSTKAAHGHAMGASGAIELCLSLGAAASGWIPGTVTLTEVDPELPQLELPIRSGRIRPGLVMNNSFGFGGMNASILVDPSPELRI